MKIKRRTPRLYNDYSNFEENPSDLTVFGLKPPSIQLTIQSGKKDTAQSLLIGAKKEGGRYYAKTGHANKVFTLRNVYHSSTVYEASVNGILNLQGSEFFAIVFSAEIDYVVYRCM